MELSSFVKESGKRMFSGTRVLRIALMLTMMGVVPGVCRAQAVSAADREALVRLHADRGGRAEDVDALLQVASEASTKGVPPAPLVNKIREGLSKGAAPQRIEAVVRQMAGHLESAERLIRETDSAAARASVEPAVTLLAEAFGSGVTLDEARELNRQAQAPGRPPVAGDVLASAAKGLSFIKDARLPAADGIAVMAEGVRQGFRPYQILDLGREVKRREADYREGRASLRALRDAIARGERPEQILRPTRIEPVERPAASLPEAVSARPERARPERTPPVERPQRPEQPQRPSR
jgi:hypothetical protein